MWYQLYSQQTGRLYPQVFTFVMSHLLKYRCGNVVPPKAKKNFFTFPTLVQAPVTSDPSIGRISDESIREVKNCDHRS